MKRFLAILFILSLLAGLLPTVSFAAEGRLEISVPSGVSITLRKGFAGSGSTVSASSTSTSDGYKTYIYNDLVTGTYSFTTSGSGYNALTKDIYYVAGTTETIVKDPGKKAGNGWEQGSGNERNDEIIGDDGLFASTTTAWPGYEFVFQTPTFTDDTIAKQQFTPHDTMISFLKGLLEICPNMYYYKLGNSPKYGYELPLVVFTNTDLTGLSMEEAGALVQANGKPTVFHQAQIHGNEPAPGEAALSLAYATATGNLTAPDGGDILDHVNIMIMPRINADGAKNFQRNNVADGLNMNRGYLSVRSTEVQDLISAYNAFRPEIVLDAHEWTPDNTSEVSYFDDLWLFTSGSANNSSIQLETGIEMMETVFEDAEAQGIRPYFYSQNMTYTASENVMNSLAPIYYGLRGSLAFCVETRGIGIGRGCYERRVFSHYITAESMIHYAAEHAEEVMEKCETERARIAAAGTTFGSDAPLALQHKNTTYSKSYPRPTLDLKTNTVTNPNNKATPTICYTASRTRARPTAYVLKAGTSGLSSVLKVMDIHGIPYYKIEDTMTVSLKQYSGRSTSASLSSEKSVVLEAGSYIFPMNHSDGNILAMLMEPDVTDTNSSASYSTFVQRSILSASSIYRYEGNLDDLLNIPDAPNSLGVIHPTVRIPTGIITGLDPSKIYEYRSESDTTYTAVPAGSIEIPDLLPGVYYVRFAAIGGAMASEAVKLTVNPQPEGEKFTVNFYDAEGKLLETQQITETCAVSYKGATPVKSSTEEVHYIFSAWVDRDGAPANMDCVVMDSDFYPTFTEEAHSYTSTVLSLPTCDSEGTLEYRCETCDRSYTESIDATGHDPVVIPGTAPTCTVPGLTDGSRCNTCSAILVEQSVLSPKGHTPQTVPGTAPTCLSSGRSNGELCADCGTVLVQQTTLPRLGHSYKYADNGDGTHTGTCDRCGKSQTADHSYDEANTCTLCGYSDSFQLPIPDESVAILHSLNLASDISINYVVAASQLASYDSFYLECVLPLYEDNRLSGTRSIRVEPEARGSYYYFTLKGVTAVQMGDSIEAILYMSSGNASYYSNTDIYSVADYAYAQLAKAQAAHSLKALCADLLYYGSCAQIYKNYRTDALADGAMTEEQRSYLSNSDAVTFGNNSSILDDVDDPIITWVGKSLSLESKVILKFVVDTASYEGFVEDLSLRVSYTDYKGEAKTLILTDPQVYGTGSTRYVFDFDGLLAAELRSVVEVAVFEGDTQLSSTLRYSADTYGNNKTGTLLTLCKALMAYSDSALAYFG